MVEGCAAWRTGAGPVEADLRIARGLDYYTGTVFETRLDGYERLGSVCSGRPLRRAGHRRPDDLPRGRRLPRRQPRSLVPLLADGVLAGSRSVPSAVLVALVDEDGRAASDALADQLRANGVPCEVAASAQKFGKQIRYAERRGIPYVLFPGTGGRRPAAEVKDIRSGEQLARGPGDLDAAASDLKPAVVPTSPTVRRRQHT